MLIYNVTTKVDWSIAGEWLQWMKEVHLPDVMRSGCFEKNHLVRILDVDEEEGPTYAAQFFVASKGLYEEYINNYAPALRKDVNERWGNKYISFRSLMELID